MRTLMHLCSDRATMLRRPWLVGMLPDGEPDPGAGGGGAPAKTFTQEDVNRMTTEARDRGQRQALKDLGDKFGMSPDEAAVKLKELQDAEAARMTEVERKEKAAADKEAAAVAREAAAAERERAADIRSALAEAGATGENLTDAAVLVRGSIDGSADTAAVAAAVDALKTRRPELFTAKNADGGDPPAPHTDPGKPPPARVKPNQTAKQRAQARLESMGVLKPANT